MNRKRIYAFAATLIVIALVIVLWQEQDRQKSEKVVSPQNETASEHQAPTGESTPSPLEPTTSGAKGMDEQHKEDVRQGLEAIVEGLKQMGAKEVPPVSDALKEAMATGDPGTMRRAFHEATYGRFARMSESIPAMKAYLGSSDPYVRYLAAEALLRVGDQSGVEPLLAIVQNDGVVAQGGKDLRFAAATTLATFNVTGASESIRNLYSITKEGELLRSLATLGLQASEANSWNYVSSNLAIENYAKEGSTRFIPQISATFEQSSDLATKNAAAWSLARMTGGDQYVNHLIETARPAIEAQSDKGGFNESTEALRYLGSIQTPAAVGVLEQALGSQNPTAVQYATVNLLFNQPGGSKKAEQVVLNELQTAPKSLGIDLSMQIASKLDDPQIKAAAEAYDLKTGGDRWRYWGVERSNWPIENWAYDYAVTLNP